jgi:hypothetical protein
MEYITIFTTMYPPQEPIGNRPLTFFEEEDMRICGLTSDEVAFMTSDELRERASMIADYSDLFIGC